MLLKCLILICSLQVVAHAKPVMGTEFVFAFPCTSLKSKCNMRQYYLIANNQNSATATITLTYAPSGRPFNQTFSVPANSMQKIAIPQSISNSLSFGNNQALEKKGVTVLSTTEITLYALIDLPIGSLDEGVTYFLVLPTNMLSNRYSYAPDVPDRIATLFVATQDNTHFTFGQNGQNVTLNKMESYFLPNNSEFGSMSISSDAPFALIFYGVDLGGPYAALMALPNTYSSTAFPILLPSEEGTGGTVGTGGTPDYISYFALYDNTTISIYDDSLKNRTLNAGEYFTVIGSGVGWVTANNPIQIIVEHYRWHFYHFSIEYSDGYFTYPLGQEHFLNTSVQFYSNGKTREAMILTTQQGTGKIAVDDVVIPALNYKRIPQTLIYYAYSTIRNDEFHTIRPTEAGVSYLATATVSDYWESSYVINFDVPV